MGCEKIPKIKKRPGLAHLKQKNWSKHIEAVIDLLNDPYHNSIQRFNTKTLFRQTDILYTIIMMIDNDDDDDGDGDDDDDR